MNKLGNSKARTLHEVACPFCGLLCDDLVIENKNNKLRVRQNGCAIAKTNFEKPVLEASPQIKGKTAALTNAIDKIISIFNASNTPLITGLGSDAEGIRQLMHLADHSGAVVDHMHGHALMRNTLVLQDLGWIMTSMAEIKNRADLIIFAGTDAKKHSRFFERVIWNERAMFNKRYERDIVYIGEDLDSRPGRSPPGKHPTVLKCKNDQIAEVISALHALIVGDTFSQNDIVGIKLSNLKKLAERMKTARYGVFVWSSSELNFPHAELTIQSICEIVKYLTRITRFAGFSLGGNDGATTANNICTWQSGYPLRVNFNKGYPEYDPNRYSTASLLKNKEVDAMLWVSSFHSKHKPLKASIPTIVLGQPQIELSFTPDVYIPVSIPGVDHKGQLFRTDSVVALPLKQCRKSSLPSVGSIIEQVISRI